LLETGCRGFDYYCPEDGMAADGQAEQLVLPVLTVLLPHVCAHWHHVTEVGLVLQPNQQAGLQR
jgi:hypothetical protein